jgi:murein DD-endopeptidase MepM/ murein hydrolase activator NlpD
VLGAITIVVAYVTITGAALHGRHAAFAAPVTGLSLPGASSSMPSQNETVLRPLAINRTKRAEPPVTAKQQEVVQQLAALSATPTAEPPTPVPEDALVRAASVQPTPELPQYQVYTVEAGDTVSSIAAKFGIAAEYVTANNIEIQNADFLTLGQSIIIPAGNGILHEVRYGETLSDIAARYQVTVDAITSFSSNHITAADDIKELQMVFVPGGQPPAPPATAPAAEPNPTDPTDATAPGEVATAVPGAAAAASGPASQSGLIWPVVGPISSYYGPSHPLGIDIDGFNLPGASIAAATSGTVVFAGGNPCCSYGLYVVVMSPGGIETLYAHLSSISVNQGDTVEQGAQIGIIGSTGYSTGRHLHFEVIDNGVRENPLDYLP